MSVKKIQNFIVKLFCLILLSIFSGCGDLSDEETIERIRFAEFFLFPTAPYIDKSYIEVVSEGEIASVEIDFAVEMQEIQKVYSAFVTAYIKEDMAELTETLDTAAGMEYGTSSVIIHGWNNIRKYIEVNWTGQWGTDCIGDPNSQLTDFHIRPKNVKVPWMEASAKGLMFYYHPDRPVCYQDIGKYYFTKRSGNWRIHQIDGSKFFTDTRYKVPE